MASKLKSFVFGAGASVAASWQCITINVETNFRGPGVWVSPERGASWTDPRGKSIPIYVDKGWDWNLPWKAHSATAQIGFRLAEPFVDGKGEVQEKIRRTYFIDLEEEQWVCSYQEVDQLRHRCEVAVKMNGPEEEIISFTLEVDGIIVTMRKDRPPWSRLLQPVLPSTDAEETCAFCQEGYHGDSDAVKLEGCGHVFHKGCINKWFGQCKANGQVICPVCRRKHVIQDDRPCPSGWVPWVWRSTSGTAAATAGGSATAAESEGSGSLLSVVSEEAKEKGAEASASLQEGDKGKGKSTSLAEDVGGSGGQEAKEKGAEASASLQEGDKGKGKSTSLAEDVGGSGGQEATEKGAEASASLEEGDKCKGKSFVSRGCRRQRRPGRLLSDEADDEAFLR